MASTLSPEESSTDDALCLQDRPSSIDLAVANARSFPDAVRAACHKFCEGRPDLLAHAVWSPAIGELLEPLGTLFGEEAIVHGELAGGIFRLIAGEGETTPITAAALKAGGPVWIPSIPRRRVEGHRAAPARPWHQLGRRLPVRLRRASRGRG